MSELNLLVRKCIANLKPYTSARDEFAGNANVFLDANENPFGELNRYPDPYQRELRAVLANMNGCDAANIAVTNGSDEAIDLLLRIFAEPGVDRVLTFAPTYGMYAVSAAINNVQLEVVERTRECQIALANAQDALQSPHVKMVFVCSPNNPDGSVLPERILVELLEAFSGIVVVDEAYIDFAPEASALKLLKRYPRLVILRTLSKAWGLAGVRIGYVVAHPDVVGWMDKVKPPYNVSTLNQEAAIAVLRDRYRFETQKQVILTERMRLAEVLNSLPSVIKVYPSQANFLLVAFDNANTVYAALVQQGIVVRNRSSQVANALRITIGTPHENQLLISILQTLCHEKSTFY